MLLSPWSSSQEEAVCSERMLKAALHPPRVSPSSCTITLTVGVEGLKLYCCLAMASLDHAKHTAFGSWESRLASPARLSARMVSLETLNAPRPMIGCKQDAILTSDELMESSAGCSSYQAACVARAED